MRHNKGCLAEVDTFTIVSKQISWARGDSKQAEATLGGVCSSPARDQAQPVCHSMQVTDIVRAPLIGNKWRFCKTRFQIGPLKHCLRLPRRHSCQVSPWRFAYILGKKQLNNHQKQSRYDKKLESRRAEQILKMPFKNIAMVLIWICPERERVKGIVLSGEHNIPIWQANHYTSIMWIKTLVHQKSSLSFS